MEAELGGISGDETGISSGEMAQTALIDPDDAVCFVQETGIDSLATLPLPACTLDTALCSRSAKWHFPVSEIVWTGVSSNREN